MRTLTFAALSCTVACAATPHRSGSPEATFVRAGVEFERLDENVWMHTSYADLEKWGRVRTNGLIVLHGESALLVDTAWTNEQTEVVLDAAAETLGAPVTVGVFTHAHRDKMGGVEALRERGIATYANRVSNQLASERGLVPAEHDLVGIGAMDPLSSSGRRDLAPVEVFFPGEGHTIDNVVVGVRGATVLFGGCLIRPGASTSLGNTADGNIATWADAARAAGERFPDATLVVPSHGPPAGRELLTHTAQLARKAVSGG